MGTLLSPVPEISRLRFVNLDGFPRKVKRIAKADGALVAELESGALWSPRINGRFAYTPGDFSTPVLRLLVKMGRLTKAQVDAHLARVQRNEEREELRDDAQTFARIAKRRGLKLTRQQVRALGIEVQP